MPIFPAPVPYGSYSGPGGLNRIFNGYYRRNQSFLFFKLYMTPGYKPPGPIPPPPPAYRFIYKNLGISNFKSANFDSEYLSALAYNKFQLANLYSPTNNDIITGYLFNNISILNQGNISVQNTSNSYLCLDKGNIYYEIGEYNQTNMGYFKPGQYKFTIISGTGDFIDIKGYIIYDVSDMNTIISVYY